MATANTASGLAALPVELIQHIGSFLIPACVPGERPYPCYGCARRRPGCRQWFLGQLDISRLSRACKPLRDVIQPLVFQCCPDGGPRPIRRLILLARTLIARPDLRHHVKFLMSSDVYEDLEPADNQFVQDAIVELGLPAVPDSWISGGEPEYHLLPLELVLAHTPNLEYLRMPLDYDWSLHLLPHLLKTRPPFLPNLKSLEVFHHFTAGDRFEISMDAVETIVTAAPSLEALCLPNPNWMSGGAFAPLPNLRRLYWQSGCATEMDGLAAMLDAAPQLQALALPWDAMDDQYNYCDDRGTADAWEAIELRKDSLRELRLDIRENTLQGSGKLDSFLSTLFPPSIREVTFWRLDGEEMRAAMVRLAKVVAVGRYPDLKTVVLAPSERSERQGYNEWHNADKWNEVKEELEEWFRTGGVKFELRWDSPYWMASSLD
ncbi:hypothetical protein C8A05DRAFT_20395 [Staphylotrichum tortipilum]|uniref:Uncharacterized protein n=1 Tax=Staphylotrichum tortipilum TaxID=2831512 RepID=A0AAN6MAW3_9PEZI|nr:hypothetical protein C8A05DRAFT_20395 [Staphylotrichum longicolle]